MDIQVSTSALTSALAQVADVAADKKSTMPILSCVLLTAEQTPEGGTLSLQTYDLEIGMALSHSCEIKKPGAVALPAKTLLDVMKAMPTPVTRIKLAANNRVEITSGEATFRLAGQPAADFPAMPDVGEGDYLPTNDLADALGKVAFAMSTDETRYNLNGVYFDLPQGKLVATDGHRMCMAEVEPSSIDAGVIVSKKAVAKLRKLVGSEGENKGEFCVSGASLLYRRLGLRLVARLIDGSFPDYKQVIPERSKAPALVERAALRDALNRVMLMLPDRSSAIQLSFEKGQVAISSRNPEQGDASDMVKVTGAPDMKINLNGHYLLDMLTTTDARMVELHLGDDMSPVIVAPEGDKTHTYVLMPMRG